MIKSSIDFDKTKYLYFLTFIILGFISFDFLERLNFIHEISQDSWVYKAFDEDGAFIIENTKDIGWLNGKSRIWIYGPLYIKFANQISDLFFFINQDKVFTFSLIFLNLLSIYLATFLISNFFFKDFFLKIFFFFILLEIIFFNKALLSILYKIRVDTLLFLSLSCLFLTLFKSKKINNLLASIFGAISLNVKLSSIILVPLIFVNLISKKIGYLNFIKIFLYLIFFYFVIGFPESFINIKNKYNEIIKVSYFSNEFSFDKYIINLKIILMIVSKIGFATFFLLFTSKHNKQQLSVDKNTIFIYVFITLLLISLISQAGNFPMSHYIIMFYPSTLIITIYWVFYIYDNYYLKKYFKKFFNEKIKFIFLNLYVFLLLLFSSFFSESEKKIKLSLLNKVENSRAIGLDLEKVIKNKKTLIDAYIPYKKDKNYTECRHLSCHLEMIKKLKIEIIILNIDQINFFLDPKKKDYYNSPYRPNYEKNVKFYKTFNPSKNVVNFDNSTWKGTAIYSKKIMIWERVN